jgi:hypothetical protein
MSFCARYYLAPAISLFENVIHRQPATNEHRADQIIRNNNRDRMRSAPRSPSNKIGSLGVWQKSAGELIAPRQIDLYP